MAKGNVAKATKKDKILKVCTECNKELAIINFYNSESPLFTDGKAPICKKCIVKKIDCDNMQSVYDILQSLDLPFLINYWDSAKIKNPSNPWGVYIRIANSKMNEFKGKRWKDSYFVKKEEESSSDCNTYNDYERDLVSEFRPTKEMLIRWGTKYKPEQYIKLENFYIDMKEKNNIDTPQEEDYLKKLAVISMKMDEELELGNYSQAKSLGDLFSKYMADSKFRAMDKNDADKTGGIRNFSTIYAEVEKDDFIPPWEYYRKIKNVSQDIIDKCIMHMENFTLRLNRVEKMTEPPIDTPKLDESELIGIDDEL